MTSLIAKFHNKYHSVNKLTKRYLQIGEILCKLPANDWTCFVEFCLTPFSLTCRLSIMVGTLASWSRGWGFKSQQRWGNFLIFKNCRCKFPIGNKFQLKNNSNSSYPGKQPNIDRSAPRSVPRWLYETNLFAQLAIILFRNDPYQ